MGFSIRFGGGVYLIHVLYVSQLCMIIIFKISPRNTDVGAGREARGTLHLARATTTAQMDLGLSARLPTWRPAINMVTKSTAGTIADRRVANLTLGIDDLRGAHGAELWRSVAAAPMNGCCLAYGPGWRWEVTS